MDMQSSFDEMMSERKGRPVLKKGEGWVVSGGKERECAGARKQFAMSM